VELKVAQFETTDYAQMRRCRMAHLFRQPVNEQFKDGEAGIAVSGLIRAVRPDLTCRPLRWIITIDRQQADVLELAE
jgi:hypothetical protein